MLVAGLQRSAAAETAMILVDETEYGLEPHRIIRFVTSLGAKDGAPPLQVFMTTHSPVVLRELSGNQLFVVRRQDERHNIKNVGTDDDTQGTMRLYPDAFLAPSVLVCEGATEVGFVRGIDLFRVESEETSIAALGLALVDCCGGEPERCFKRAAVFQKLGYRTGILRDSDKAVERVLETTFTDGDGALFAWREGRAIEDELFLGLSDTALDALLNLAVELHGEELIDANINSALWRSFWLDRRARRSACERLLGRNARGAWAGSSIQKGWLVQICDLDGTCRARDHRARSRQC
jgi:putative ATP-dependent endonuclease of the OLD family